MKIIHCGDLHLDSDLRSKYSSIPASGRKAELLASFRRLCRWAQDNNADAIMICGDLFDTEDPSPSAVRTVEDLILANGNLLFFYLRGNHDGRRALFCSRPKPGNLILFGSDWSQWELKSPESGGRSVCIAGREPVSLISGSGQALSSFTAPALDPTSLNIVMLHGQVVDGRACTDPETVPLGLLRGAGIDYLALGHLHHFRSFSLDARGTAAYCGCLEGRGFDECGECGFVLIDTGTNNTDLRIRFVPFASRRLYRVTCDITGCVSDTEVFGRAEAALRSSGAGERDLVRLELTGSLEYGCSPDPGLMQKEWEDDFHYFEYRNCAEPVIHSEDFVCDATLKGEFVRTVNAADDLSEDERVRVLRCGLRALSGKSPF